MMINEYAKDAVTTGPLSFSQQSLWLLELVGEGKCTYNVGWVLRFNGSLNVSLLEKSFNYLIQRHSCLRTVFLTEDGEALQAVMPEVDFQLRYHSIADFSAEERLAEVKRCFDLEVNTPFDFANGPLLRCKLLQTAPDEHYLVMGVHHIITDGWSMVILLKELAHIYQKFSQGKEPQLPLLPLEYHQYSRMQLAADQEEKMAEGFAYWQKQLAPPLTKLELPVDFPRPSHLEERGGRCFFRLSEQTMQRIKEACKQERVTPYMYLLTVFKVLLHRYTQQDDLVIGTPVANRSKREIYEMFGFFVNVLVLRSDYGGNPTFSEVLEREKETVISGMRHMEVPLGELVKKINPERSSGFSQLFQVMFVMQNVPIPDHSFGDVVMSPVNVDHFNTPEYGWIHSDSGWSEFDLTLELSSHDTGIVGAFEYNSTLFKKETILALQKRFCLLLESVLSDSSQQLRSLDFLLPEEMKMLGDWNSTRVEFDAEKTIVDLFVEQAATCPDTIALTFEGESLTYLELDQQANQMAHYLQKHGVIADTLVAVCLERSLEMVVALLAVLKSGGAYVPLDASYPQERLAYMLEDCQAPVIVSSEHLLRRLPRQKAHIVCLEQEDVFSGYSSTVPLANNSPDSLAYVIYTSGSTGKPKGVMISRRAITKHMQWILAEHNMGADDVVLQKTPFSFDASVWEFFAPLLSGGRLVIARPDGHQDPEYMCQTIQQQGVTILQLVPSVLGLLLYQPSFQHCTSLRLFFCG